MREHVTITLGGKDYSLLPTYRVLTDFEAKYGPMTAHLIAMSQAQAMLKVRAYLVFLGIKAAKDADIGGMVFRGDLTTEAIATAMFEAGVLDEAMGEAEVDFTERLLYAPEKYREKKAERARLAEQMKAMEAASPLFSDLQPLT